MSKVPVFDDKSNIIARVNPSSNLDFWNGHNWTSGSEGRHLGITKLRDGRFVLIYVSQWDGERDYAEIVSKAEALQALLRANDEKLLEQFFPDWAETLEEEDLEQ